MKKLFYLLPFIYFLPLKLYAQLPKTVTDSIEKKSWSCEGIANSYIFNDGYLFVPVVAVNRNWLHLETRYNYEDEQTISAFGGYNFSFGKKFTFDVTPMVGCAAGNTNGVIPALEFTLGYKDFELYNESEYLVNFDTKKSNYLYAWSELNYYPIQWLSIGLAGQRTRLYKTDLDYQRGFSTGIYTGIFSLKGYVMNLGFDDPFYLIAISVGIE